ncbi:hypothetical protein EMCRGX_G018608 [Ephydatia muelleri]
MPSRNRKKRSKQRAEYLQKQDDILSQENKAKARARYKADPERKKASVRDSYKADPEKKKASRYQEDLEENRAAKRQKYEDNSAAIKASERNLYWNDPAVRLAKRAAERKRYRRGHRTTTTTQSQPASIEDESFYLHKVGSEVTLDKKHDYYYQVQGQMAIWKKPYSDFICRTTKGLIITRIQADGRNASPRTSTCNEMFIANTAMW